MPLLEIVSEPDLRSPERGGASTSTLLRARSLRYLGVNDGNMEEGSLPLRRQRLGAAQGRRRSSARKTELKNMNSFRFLEQAIDYEIERQMRR